MNHHSFLRTGAAVVAAGTLVALGSGPAAAADPAADATDTVADADTVAALVQPSIVSLSTTYSGYVYDSLLNGGEYLTNGLDYAKEFTVTVPCTAFAVSSGGWLATSGACVDPDAGSDAIARAAAQWAVDTDFYEGDYAVSVLAGDYRVDAPGTSGDQLAPNTVERVVEASWSSALDGRSAEQRASVRVASLATSSGDSGVALLEVDTSELNALPLAEGQPPAAGTDVVVGGYSGAVRPADVDDLEPGFETLGVARFGTVPGGVGPVLQLDAPTTEGMSGGPAVDLDGDVVGVIGSGSGPASADHVVPVERLQELMSRQDVPNTVSDTTLAYRDGVRATLDGDKEAAVDALTPVVAAQPGNELAQDYLDQAEALPDPAPAAEDPGSSLVRLLAAGGAALLVAVAALVAVTRRRRRSTPVPTYPAPSYPAPSYPAPPVAHPAPVPAGAPLEPAIPGTTIATGFTRGDQTRPVGFTAPYPTSGRCGGCGATDSGQRYCSSCGCSLR